MRELSAIQSRIIHLEKMIRKGVTSSDRLDPNNELTGCTLVGSSKGRMPGDASDSDIEITDSNLVGFSTTPSDASVEPTLEDDNKIAVLLADLELRKPGARAHYTKTLVC